MAAANTLDAIVHDLAQASAALRAARAAGAGARLFSPPGAARTLGPGYWRALVAALAAGFPGVEFVAVLDGADDAGAVMAALGEGIGAVRFTGSPAARRRLAEIAAKAGARLVDAPLPALDLGRADDAEAACRAALHCHQP